MEVSLFVPRTMTLGTHLTVYLLLVVLAVTGLNVYLSVLRTRTNLLMDVHRELDSICRTLRVVLEKVDNDTPERYFDAIALEMSSFANILGVIFYDRRGQVAYISPTLRHRALPDVDISLVIKWQTPTEGILVENDSRRYYRAEPIVSSRGEGIGAFLLLEQFPYFTQELRGRLIRTVLTSLAILTILAILTSVVVHRSITVPLQVLTRQVMDVGPSHATQPRFHSVARTDEIGLLAREFERMCERLDQAQRQLIIENDEKLRLERALRQSEQLAMLGQLASHIAHEIGTPLNIIRGRAQQALQREAVDEKQSRTLHTIVSQIERISRFIRQLLTLARRPEPRLRQTHLNEVVRRTWDMVSDQSVTPGVEMVLRLASDPPPVWGDPDQLQQVFLNLWMNAIHAVGRAGTITVSTRVAPTGQPNGQEVIGETVEVVVEDTGPGIAPEHQAKIFEPFFTTKSMAEGSGLGLAISQDIVRSHQGRLYVESTLGQGSRFIVALPSAGAADDRQEALTHRQ